VRTLLAALCLFPALALGQTYPAKPIRIVLPFAPGGIADITTRTIAPKLGEALGGQQIIVENTAPAASAPPRPWRAPSPTATRCCCSPTATR